MYADAGKGFAVPQAIVTHFHLRADDVVADFGSGSGHYIQPLSDAIGSNGRLYLCEIQQNLVDALSDKARQLRLKNAHVIWCDIEKPMSIKLRDGELDAGLLSNIFFQLDNKASALKEIARTIHKGGKFFMIDWSDSFGGLGPKSTEVVDEREARHLVEQAGFTYERQFPAGDHHYGMAFRKN